MLLKQPISFRLIENVFWISKYIEGNSNTHVRASDFHFLHRLLLHGYLMKNWSHKHPCMRPLCPCLAATIQLNWVIVLDFPGLGLPKNLKSDIFSSRIWMFFPETWDQSPILDFCLNFRCTKGLELSFHWDLFFFKDMTK